MRSLIVDNRLVQRALLDVVQTGFRLSRPKALDALKQRRITICGGVCADPARRVKLGQHIQLQTKPPVAKNSHGIVVRFIDEHLLVVEKPAGLTTVRHADEIAALGKRAKKHLPPTLVDLLPGVLAPLGEPSRVSGRLKTRIRAVHRLDKETSGLVVLARTPAAESQLGKQFRAHATSRRYLALVRGQAKDARIESHLVPDRGDGRRGSVSPPLPPGEGPGVRGRAISPRPNGGEGPGVRGQLAVTHVRVLESFGACTLVECELETGRTHQVRIHLGEAGTPLCGERIYDRPLHGKPLPDDSGANRPMLHAAFLAFDHPATGKRLEWEAKMPKDMRDLISSFCARPAPREP